MSKHLFGAKFDNLGQLADKIYNIGNFVDIPILFFLQFFLFLFFNVFNNIHKHAT